MILRLTLDLPEEAAYLHMTRAVGRAVLESLRAEHTIIDDVETVLTELYSNVLRHARSAQGRFSITLDYHADHIAVTVEDRGGGFSFKDVPPPGTVRPDLDGSERLGGFGLQLVAALSDRLEFHRQDEAGMRIIAEKRLSYEDRAAARSAEHMDGDHAAARVDAHPARA